MSEIIEILKTNGVNFIECFFKTNLYLNDEEWNTVGKEKDFRIDFSDGRNYLGSLDANTDWIDDVLSEPLEAAREKEAIREFRFYLGKETFNTPTDIIIDFKFDKSRSIHGSCVITCETTEIGW